MLSAQRLTPRQWLIVAHDLVATGLALVVTLLVRFEGPRLSVRLEWLPTLLPLFVVYAGVVYFLFRLHEAKWRFTSLPELFDIVRASTVLAVSLLVLDYVLVAPNVYGERSSSARSRSCSTGCCRWRSSSAPRIAYRYFRYARTLRHRRAPAMSMPTLILGRAADAEVLLRAIESGAVSKIWPVGILSPSRPTGAQAIRGVPVLGGFDDIRARGRRSCATRGTTVIAAGADADRRFEPEADAETMLMQARRLGIATSRLPSLDEGGEALRLAPVAVEDLLLRPSVKIDYAGWKTS